jgi:hypothetical protein
LLGCCLLFSRPATALEVVEVEKPALVGAEEVGFMPLEALHVFGRRDGRVE